MKSRHVMSCHVIGGYLMLTHGVSSEMRNFSRSAEFADLTLFPNSAFKSLGAVNFSVRSMLQCLSLDELPLLRLPVFLSSGHMASL